jgi:hypothetical protein
MVAESAVNERYNSLLRKMEVFKGWETFPERKSSYPKVRINQEYANSAEDFCNKNYGDNWVWASPVHTNWTDLYFIHAEDALITKLKFPAYTD